MDFISSMICVRTVCNNYCIHTQAHCPILIHARVAITFWHFSGHCWQIQSKLSGRPLFKSTKAGKRYIGCLYDKAYTRAACCQWTLVDNGCFFSLLSSSFFFSLKLHWLPGFPCVFWKTVEEVIGPWSTTEEQHEGRSVSDFERLALEKSSAKTM